MRFIAPLLFVVGAVCSCAATEQASPTMNSAGPASSTSTVPADDLVPPTLPRQQRATDDGVTGATEPPSDQGVRNEAPSATEGLDDQTPAEGQVRTDDQAGPETPLNAVGNPVTLDEDGSLACAAAEVLLTALEESTDPAPALARLVEHGGTTANPELREAAAALATPVEIVQVVDVLEICILRGHEL